MPKQPRLIFKTDLFVKQVRAATHYYKKEASPTVADRFLVALSHAIERLQENPHCSPRYNPPAGFAALRPLHYRRLNLTGFSSFPFTLFYEIEPERLTLQALFHHAQDRETHLLSSKPRKP